MFELAAQGLDVYPCTLGFGVRVSGQKHRICISRGGDIRHLVAAEAALG